MHIFHPVIRMYELNLDRVKVNQHIKVISIKSYRPNNLYTTVKWSVMMK